LNRWNARTGAGGTIYTANAQVIDQQHLGAAQPLRDPRQLQVPRTRQELGIFPGELPVRRLLRELRNDVLHHRIAAFLVDLQEQRPGADPKDDVGVGLADLDGGRIG
jgi:hypothetical protein